MRGIAFDITTARNPLASKLFYDAKEAVESANYGYAVGDWQNADKLLEKAARMCAHARLLESNEKHGTK